MGRSGASGPLCGFPLFRAEVAAVASSRRVCKEVPVVDNYHSMKRDRVGQPRHTAAFRTLFEEQYDRVARFAQRRVDNQSDAADVAAETFRRAWERCLREDRLPSTGWLFATARFVVGDLYRSRDRAAQLEVRLREQATLPSLDDNSDDRVLEALSGLSQEDQELLRLRYWDELGGSEIAELLSISTSALWVRLHRARKRFTGQYVRTNQRSSS